MSKPFVIARPYAKAIFDYALSTNQLDEWTDVLKVQACVVLDEAVQTLIRHPASTDEQLTILLLAPFQVKKQHAENDALNHWVMLLVAQKRLLALPEIYCQYQARCEAHRRLVRASVKSFSPLSDAQERALVERLTAVLNRQVELTVEVDPTLLGGMVVRAGELVIDGSLQTKLKEMYTNLVSR